MWLAWAMVLCMHQKQLWFMYISVSKQWHFYLAQFHPVNFMVNIRNCSKLMEIIYHTSFGWIMGSWNDVPERFLQLINRLYPIYFQRYAQCDLAECFLCWLFWLLWLLFETVCRWLPTYQSCLISLFTRVCYTFVTAQFELAFLGCCYRISHGWLQIISLSRLEIIPTQAEDKGWYRLKLWRARYDAWQVMCYLLQDTRIWIIIKTFVYYLSH